ncbi:MAG: NifB/NifX family molybdenum-iron cluster-binding protein, partial [Anaerolineales bacterium]
DEDLLHCKQIVVVDENDRFEAWSNPFKEDTSATAEVQLAHWIVDQGIQVLITNLISPESRAILENASVKIYQAKEGAVLSLVEQVRGEMQKEGEN